MLPFQYASQQQLPLHDYWFYELERFQAFQKEVALMQSEVLPAVSTLTASVGKLSSNIAALEEVLLVLLENKEEQARAEAAAKKEKELNEQKNRFLLATHNRNPSRGIPVRVLCKCAVAASIADSLSAVLLLHCSTLCLALPAPPTRRRSTDSCKRTTRRRRKSWNTPSARRSAS